MSVEELYFKISLVGDTTVGKTSLIHKFLNLDPVNNYTLGATSTRAETQVDGKTVVLNIWDTAGTYSFRNLLPIYAKGSHAAIIVFDQFNEQIDYWHNYIREYVGDKTIICLAANKSDLKPTVPAETILWATNHNVKIIMTSAKDGTNVKTLFETVSRLLVQQNDKLTKGEAERKKIENKQVNVNNNSKQKDIVELENKLKIEINIKDQTAEIIKSPNIAGSIHVPRYVIYQNLQYKITSIGKRAFENATFDSLNFPEDSEVESFGYCSFHLSSFKTLQIPAKLKKIADVAFYFTKDLINIEISPKNNFFSFIDNIFLVGKNDPSNDDFNKLFYIRYDIEDAFIPSPIETINNYGFNGHENLKSVIFPKNSKLKSIKHRAFCFIQVSKIVLPESLEFIDKEAFYNVPNLFDIEMDIKNPNFSMIDKKILLSKSDKANSEFDVLFLCRRDAETVTIPSYIKTINDYAFHYCEKLKTVTFEPSSSLQSIKSFAFSGAKNLKNIALPPSISYLDKCVFSDDENFEYVEFLGKNIKFGYFSINNSHKKIIVSFPNATKIEFGFADLSTEAIIKIRRDTELIGICFEKFDNKIEHFDDTEKDKVKANMESKDIKIDKNEDKDALKTIKNGNYGNNDFQVDKYIKHIRYLESRLQKYEKVIPFDPESSKSQIFPDYEVFEDEYNKKPKDKEDIIFMDEEDESHQKVVRQIGEGATSIAYKIIDDRQNEVMCKKVLKTNNEQSNFKDLQNIYKEFEILQCMSHPCICKTIGINIQEPIGIQKNKYSDEDDEDIKIKTKTNKNGEIDKTTIALFLKYHPMNLKECLETDILNNTLKAKIVVEIAFGMSHIHKHRMIHRDLKLENVMVNYIFEAQLIDFGLVHIDEMKSTMKSLTKGIGTFAYMSPEMSNEEDYDNKTDVYSFGVLLFVLFTRKFPKQSLKDKLNNVKIQFPRPSPSISKFCIELIQKCMEFEPFKRPSFDEIIEALYKNSFKVADEIDTDLVMRRYRALNRFNELKNPNNHH